MSANAECNTVQPSAQTYRTTKASDLLVGDVVLFQRNPEHPCSVLSIACGEMSVTLTLQKTGFRSFPLIVKKSYSFKKLVKSDPKIIKLDDAFSGDARQIAAAMGATK